MTGIRVLKRVLCFVPLAGAMMFGAAQAFASPAPREALACTPKQCFLYCGGAGGICSSTGVCICR